MFLTLDEVSAKSRKPNCVFCDESKIQAIDIKQYRLRGFGFISFTPLDPITPGHLIVVPLIHVENASSDAYITGAAFELAAIIASDLGIDNYNLIANNGADADQTVFHLHVHIVPRSRNDSMITIWNKASLDKVQSKPVDQYSRPNIFKRS